MGTGPGKLGHFNKGTTMPGATRPPRIWKYLGAMFMEDKGGVQAVSFTRLLGLILFIGCLGVWARNYLADPTPDGVCVVWDIPDGMLYTLWWLIGIKGAKDFAQGFRRQNGN